MSPEEDREYSLLLLRRDFYGEKGLTKRIKQLEAKYVRDKEKESGTKSDQGNIPKDK